MPANLASALIVDINRKPATAIADPYLVPAFSLSHRVRRFVWAVVYWILFRLTPVPLFRWRAFVLRAFGAKLGLRNYFYPSARVWAPWLLTTEDCVTVAAGVELYNPAGVRLHSHVIVSQGAFLCGASHDYEHPEFRFVSAPIVLERYSWVCARAVVLMGVTLGEGSVLGASGVASKSLKPWTVYAGNPAIQIKNRPRTIQ